MSIIACSCKFPQTKPLQTGFLAGMEWCLGVRQDTNMSKTKRLDETEHPRYDVRQADALMEAEENDPARLRYRQMFWEAVPDGKVRSIRIYYSAS